MLYNIYKTYNENTIFVCEKVVRRKKKKLLLQRICENKDIGGKSLAAIKRRMF